MSTPSQLSFSLEPPEPFSPDAFVVHSGAVDAVARLDSVVAAHRAGSVFCPVLIVGLPGVGKRHFVEFARRRVKEQGWAESHIRVWLDTPSREVPDILDEQILGSFIAEYENAKRTSSLFIVKRGALLVRVEDNPHVLSRITGAEVLTLTRPSDAEFPAVIRSVLERRNLSLTPATIRYLVDRLPPDISSFDEVFYKLNEMSQPYKKAGSIHSIRQVVGAGRLAPTKG